jgi:DNA end-binding protein Ku
MAYAGRTATITLGMVQIPMRTFGATKEAETGFNRVHAGCGHQLKQVTRCPHCETDVASSEWGKGVKVGETMIEISEAELSSLPLRTAKAIDVVAFIDDSEIDPAMFESFQFCAADAKNPAGSKAYVLFRDGLQRKHQAAIAKTQVSGREVLCVIRPRGAILEMARLVWKEQLVDHESLPQPEEVAVSEAEAGFMDMLVDSMSSDIRTVLTEQTDQYGPALKDLINAKAMGATIEIAPAAEPAPAFDLMAALQASVSAAQKKVA